MKNLIVITGANSELAVPYMNYFKSRGDDIIATFLSKDIETSNNITGVRVDLQNSYETRNQILSTLRLRDLGDYQQMFFLHFIGGFRYEGLSIQKDIMKKTYETNVASFYHVYAAIQQYLGESKSAIDLTLFNIGSLSDYKVGETPWHSYSIAKNILRDLFVREAADSSTHKNNVHSLFINAGTIDTEKERALRPHADHEYRLSIDELFSQSIERLLKAKGAEHVTLYKPHPNFADKYENENLLTTHRRRLKEMGVDNFTVL